MVSICPTCKNFDPKNFKYEVMPDGPLPKHFDIVGRLPRDAAITVIPRQDLIDSAKAGCETCSLLNDARKAVIIDAIEQYRAFVCVWRFGFKDPIYFMMSNWKEQRISDLFEKMATNVHNTTGMIFAANGDGIPQLDVKIGTARLIDEDAMSPHSLAQAKRWFEECVTKHKTCVLFTDAKLPPKVLKVGSEGDEVYLIQSMESEDEYATLSYCRGMYCLNSDTMRGLLSGTPIRVADLPKTFQDAIKVTHHLGIHYLWIDSLCIAQDSKSDRLETLNIMKDVYGNALLNISADHGEDPTTGLSSDRRTFGAAKEVRPGIYARRLLSIPASWEPSHTQPGTQNVLSTRAWVLQERALSPRILHFSANELSFECDTKVQCECSSVFKPGDLRPSRTMFRKFRYSSDPDTWSNLIQLYTELKLGRQEDALDAISGLSSMMTSVSGKVYIAGLWKADLPWNLLWYRDPSGLGRGRTSERTHFPSWSWASVDCKIYMFKNPFKNQDGQSAQTCPFDSCLYIDQAEIGCENDYTCPYLNLRSHTLHVHGRKIEVFVPYVEQNGRTLAEIFVTYLNDKLKVSKIRDGFTNLDDIYWHSKMGGKGCFLLLTAMMDEVYFLILRKVKLGPVSELDGEGGYYQRIGRFGCVVDAADRQKFWDIPLKLILLV